MAGSTDTLRALRRFNALSDVAAQDALLACCASPAWTRAVAAGRPYAALGDLFEAAEAACRALTDADVAEALSGHPRIGERASGASTGAHWSRTEQGAVSDIDAWTRQELAAGNATYEQRFDRVFLVRAAGRSPEEILGELHRRLGNHPDSERREVAGQLCEITLLRVGRLFTP